MPMDRPEIIGPATLSVTQAVGSFFAFLPPLRDIRQGNVTDEIAKDVRTGEVAATVVALGVGMVITAITGSPTPVFVAALIAVILIATYELVLRRAS